jgi:O-antigen ligase
MESLGLTYNAKTNRTYLFWAVAGSLFCTGLALWSPVSLAFAAGGVFVGLFFSSRTFRWVVFPAVLVLYPFIVSRTANSFVYWGLIIHPIDWVVILLVLCTFMSRMLSGEQFFPRTGLETPIFIFFSGLILASIMSSLGFRKGIIGIGHIALYFLGFYCMVIDWQRIPVKRLWNSYRFWIFPTVGSVLWYFFSTRGGRTFGLGGREFPDLLMTVTAFQLAAFAIKGGLRHATFFGVLFLTVLIFQTRGIWISFALLVLSWILFRIFFSRGDFRKRIVHAMSIFVKIAFFLVVFLIILSPYLQTIQERASQLITGTGTVSLRFFLWGIALKLFWLHPISGVGIWQFAPVAEQLPEMKNLVLFQFVRGLSPHNRFLEILAETGILGALTFLIFYGAVLIRAWRVLQLVRTVEETCFGWGLFLSLFYFVVGTLYLETWIGYHFMFFLALLMIFERQLRLPPQI